MKGSIAFALVPLLAAPLAAAERPLTGSEITAALAGRTVAGDQDGKPWQQSFQTGGQTLYTIAGSTTNGFWEVRGDQYCSQWPPSEAWDCYAITGEGDHVTFVSSSGKSWPVKVLP